MLVAIEATFASYLAESMSEAEVLTALRAYCRGQAADRPSMRWANLIYVTDPRFIDLRHPVRGIAAGGPLARVDDG